MENFSVSNRQAVCAVAGVLFEMHPYHSPEGIDRVISAVEDVWRKSSSSSNDGSFSLVRFTDSRELYRLIDTTLKSCPEFRAYNISRKLRDAGVTDPDDSRNSGFTAVSAYDSQDDRYTDFIDLDAAVQNIVSMLTQMKDTEEGCFLCKHAESYMSTNPGDRDVCRTCSANPDYQNRHETHPLALKPRSMWTSREKKLHNEE